MPAVFGRFLAHGYLPHFLTVAGFLLAFFMVARLIGEKKAPANTFAWLLGIILIPYVGVPLYLIFGGRKLRRLAGRKAAVLPSLKGIRAQPPPPAAPAVADTVVSAGGCPPVGGNRVRLLATGEEDFLALEKHIREAKHSIHITTFILGRDETAKRLVDLLAERAREGVKVRLLLDALGCLISSTYFVNPLRKAGGEVGRFMPVLPFGSRTSANLRIHRKIAVFDHNTAMIGGRNLAKDYMGPLPYRKRWRDLGAVIEGPAAALLDQVFIADWCFATRQSEAKLRAEIPDHVVEPRGPGELQVVASGPDVPGDPLYEGIIAMIQEAEKSILIVTPYFIPDEVLLRSLMVKARAGRDVVLVLPARSNHPLTDFARRYYTRELVRAGARVLLYGEHMLHAKAVIVDDRVALIGSANFDLRSLFVNFEIGVFVHSEPEVRALREWARELMAQCRKATASSDGRRGVLGNLAEDLSRLLAPLL
ncbi:MAG TPA: phospholipase D-like domain-containing protein [Opitutaceae bacterium]|nr:phospholipase D-like domain-containing protein [Opitutaceae bacterium]